MGLMRCMQITVLIAIVLEHRLTPSFHLGMRMHLHCSHQGCMCLPSWAQPLVYSWVQSWLALHCLHSAHNPAHTKFLLCDLLSDRNLGHTENKNSSNVLAPSGLQEATSQRPAKQALHSFYENTAATFKGGATKKEIRSWASAVWSRELQEARRHSVA